jgi:hypothetical protein
MKRIYGMAMLTALFALAAAAQDVVMQKKMQDELSNVVTRMKVVGFEGGVMSNVKGAPYRADQITESTQILGDGTRIHNEHRVTIYRDSQGRVRRETPDQISIWDPNSGVGYTLDTKNMTASKMQVHVSVSSGSPGSVAYSVRTQTGDGNSGAVAGGGVVTRGEVLTNTTTNGPETTSGTAISPLIFRDFKFTAPSAVNKESLGTQVMEGVNAQGNRETSTIDAGAIGNDRPIQIVSERWYSPDLQMDVMTRHSDPRSGEEITRLANINRAEPDPSLFELPAGYQLVERKQLPAVFKFDRQ